MLKLATNVRPEIGDRFQNSSGNWYTVVNSTKLTSIQIKFDSGFTTTVVKHNMTTGQIKDRGAPSVFKVGVLGCKNVNVKEKAYRVWVEMLRRCYDQRRLNEFPTYKNCTVEESWKTFTNFKEWSDAQIKKEDWHLDKDLLVSKNKFYSQDTCIFLPSEINLFLLKTDAARGMYPVGVSLFGNKFKAQTCFLGKVNHIGLFDTAEEAFNAYKIFKERNAAILAEKWKEAIDNKAYNALLNFTVNISD